MGVVVDTGGVGGGLVELLGGAPSLDAHRPDVLTSKTCGMMMGKV